jgi:hypothetical protein
LRTGLQLQSKSCQKNLGVISAVMIQGVTVNNLVQGEHFGRVLSHFILRLLQFPQGLVAKNFTDEETV